MPVIDIDLPEALIAPADHDRLVQELGLALLRAEGLPTEGPILSHAAVYTHVVAAEHVHVLARREAAAPVRVRLTTAAGSLDRPAQHQVVAEITRLITKAANDESVAERTLVLHTEIAEGGWGEGGVALGREDFDALNASLRGDTRDQ